MPSLTSTKLELPIASFIGRILFPFGLSFLLPIFVITVVKEKEERIMIMMQMVSLLFWSWWFEVVDVRGLLTFPMYHVSCRTG